MYRIIASNELWGAVLEKDGKFFTSWGPRIYDLHEEDLHPIWAGTVQEHIEALIEGGYVRHDPPTEVENFEDWPKLVLEYEKRLKKEKTKTF